MGSQGLEPLAVRRGPIRATPGKNQDTKKLALGIFQARQGDVVPLESERESRAQQIGGVSDNNGLPLDSAQLDYGRLQVLPQRVPGTWIGTLTLENSGNASVRPNAKQVVGGIPTPDVGASALEAIPAGAANGAEQCFAALAARGGGGNRK